jgi:hypothetical protein
VTLRQAWDDQAENWLRWARTPGHDSYWRFHGRRFLELIPEPGRLTIDVGAGEGRLSRDLRRQRPFRGRGRCVAFDGERVRDG